MYLADLKAVRERASRARIPLAGGWEVLVII
jgi:hypothetical protein